MVSEEKKLFKSLQERLDEQRIKRQQEQLADRDEIIRYEADADTGLTAQQVKEHFDAGWYNETMDSCTKSVRDIIITNTFTYFNLIFVVLGVLLIIVGSFRNLTFLPVIFANSAIGIFQELRAKRVLDKMNMLNAPTAKVVRDGNISVIKTQELVADDMVVFAAGSQICADAVVASGSVLVNEALLTGESDDIVKKSGDKLMSGSFVVSGECRARLENVGRDSYISKLTMEAKAMGSSEQSEMIRSLDKLLKWVGICIIPMGVLLLWQGMNVNMESFPSAVTAMVAAVIGMIPEGLYLLTSVALAVSTIRLATQKVLLHDMKSIETLARVNVLCVDKTGTITENRMSVQEVYELPGERYETSFKMLSDFVSVMGNDNITMNALKEYFKEPTGKQAVSHTGFTSALKYSSVTYSDGVYVLGAPEMVLRESYEQYKDTIERFSRTGARVLVYARYFGDIEGKPLTQKAEPLAFVILSNPIRENAKETFRYFAEQDVQVKVISGDNPVTVSEVAIRAGIDGAERFVDASTLHTRKDIYEAAQKYVVFGRVSPEQKRQLVGALKEQGNTVAMTGDGVNDVLALKDADCSIAMASGSEAAAQAAQVVLLESDFSKMPSVVLEGRRVVNNIERSASLFLVKNIFSFIMALCSIIAAVTYPLEPAQISLIAMFTIGIPSFFLALQPNKKRIEGHFMKNVLLKALPGGLTDVICVGALVVFGNIFSLDPDGVATAATLLLAIVGFMIMIKISRPFNKLTFTVFVFCVIGLIFSSTVLKSLFYMSHMSTECIMLAVVFAFATESLFRYLSLLIEKLEQWLDSDKVKKKEPEKTQAKKESRKEKHK